MVRADQPMTWLGRPQRLRSVLMTAAPFCRAHMDDIARVVNNTKDHVLLSFNSARQKNVSCGRKRLSLLSGNRWLAKKMHHDYKLNGYHQSYKRFRTCREIFQCVLLTLCRCEILWWHDILEMALTITPAQQVASKQHWNVECMHIARAWRQLWHDHRTYPARRACTS